MNLCWAPKNAVSIHGHGMGVLVIIIFSYTAAMRKNDIMMMPDGRPSFPLFFKFLFAISL